MNKDTASQEPRISMTFRPIDTKTDRDLLLELHCSGNYESETPWARTISYEEYRRKWLSTGQPDSFLSHLDQSTEDARTIAEIAEENGTVVGFVWVVFRDVKDYGVTIAEVNDIAVVQSHRQKGVGTTILEHVEDLARERGAHLWRSETGVENTASDIFSAQLSVTMVSLFSSMTSSPVEAANPWFAALV